MSGVTSMHGTRGVAVLAVAWATLFIVGTDLFVISPLLPMIAEDYGISATLAGLSVTAFAVAYMVSAPLLGHVADRLGRRNVLTFCLAAFAAANLLSASATNLHVLIAARIIAGSMAAGVSPSVYALVGEAAPLGRRGTWLAIAVSGLLVSLSLGTPIGALAGAWFGWPPIFAALAVSSAALIWANHRIWPARHASANGGNIASLDVMKLARRLGLTVLWSTALYGMYTYLGIGLTGIGFSTGQIAEVIFFYGCGAIVGTLIGGRLADRLGSRVMVKTSLFGVCVCFLGLVLALHMGVLVDLAFGFASAAAQLFFPAQQAGLAEEFSTRRATVLAWNNSALFLGISLGSLIGAEAVASGGFRTDLIVSAAIAFIGWLASWFAAPTAIRPAAVAADLR
jgi:predicted MFS family arabinose efflux permease